MADPTLLAHLLARGASAHETEGLTDNELIGLCGDLEAARGLDMGVDELAERCGTTVERVDAIYEALGLRTAELAGFGEEDVDLVTLAVGDEHGLIDAVGDQLLRVAGVALRRVAEATIAAYVQDIENAPEQTADLVALADLNAFATRMVVEFSRALGHAFRHHMWVAVRYQRAAQQGVARPELIRTGIAFVDLVGFTPLSRTRDPRELVTLIDTFERTAFALAARAGGRVVKSIGDEVMIAADDHPTAATIALDLVEEFASHDAITPRGGVSAGEILFRLGDYYGPVVNLASRLADVAGPGEVLTDVGTGHAEAVRLRSAGERVLKGFDEPVAVWRVARAGASEGRA